MKFEERREQTFGLERDDFCIGHCLRQAFLLLDKKNL